MQVRRVEMMRLVDIGRHRVAVRRQVVDDPDPKNIAATQAQRRPGNGALIAPHVEAIAADVLIGVADLQRRPQLAADRAAQLRFDQGQALGEGDRPHPDRVRGILAGHLHARHIRAPASAPVSSRLAATLPASPEPPGPSRPRSRRQEAPPRNSLGGGQRRSRRHGRSVLALISAMIGHRCSPIGCASPRRHILVQGAGRV